MVLALTQMFSLLAPAARGGEDEETGLDEARLRLGESETAGSPLEAGIEEQALGEGVAATGEANAERGRWHLEIYCFYPLWSHKFYTLQSASARGILEKNLFLPKFLGPVDQNNGGRESWWIRNAAIPLGFSDHPFV